MSICIRWIKIDVCLECIEITVTLVLGHDFIVAWTSPVRLHCIYIYITATPFQYVTVTLVVVHDLVVARTRRVRIHAHGLQIHL